MKKATLLISASILLVTTACKKNRTCTCTETITSTSATIPADNWQNTVTNTKSFKKVKKSDAELVCYSSTFSESSPNWTQTTVIACTLK